MSETRHKLLEEHIYDGIVLSACFRPSVLDRVKGFKFYDDDVLIVTYPKSGTTWYQEIVWLLKNDADVKTAKEVLQDIRVPFLEIDKGKVPLDIDILEEQKTPRLMKSHLPYHFFENELTQKKTKVVFGARNIKDTLVSMYHFYRMNEQFGNMTGPFSEFFQLFKEKHLAYGDWFDHTLGYWNNRENYNLFVVKYEDLHKDASGTIRKLAEFLEVELSDEKIQTIIDHVSFDSMKESKSVNKSHHPGFNHKVSPFMRKGKVGTWKSQLTVEQNEYVDALYQEKIVGSGMEFDFEI